MSQDPHDLRVQAYDCFEKGDFQAALKLLTNISSQHGNNTELSNDIAVVLHKLGRTTEALTVFREAQALSGEGRSLLVDNLLDIIEQLRDRELQNKQYNNANLINQKAKMSSVYEDFAAVMLKQAFTIWQNDSAAEFHRASAVLSDDEWFQVLYDSVGGKLFHGHIPPGFIAEETQRAFVGSSGVSALHEAANFIRVVLKYAREHGITFNDKTRAVDFGSGWGRYTRFMLKYIHPDNLLLISGLI